MGSLHLPVSRQAYIDKMNHLFSVIYFTSIVHWIGGAPFLSDDGLRSQWTLSDICRKVELQQTGHHLLADPQDCRNFIACQYLSGSGSRSQWLAYSMSCPTGTHFDGVYCVEGEECRQNKFFDHTQVTYPTPSTTNTTTTTTTSTATTTTSPTTTSTTITTMSTTTLTTPTTTTTTTTTTRTTSTAASTTPTTTASNQTETVDIQTTSEDDEDDTEGDDITTHFPSTEVFSTETVVEEDYDVTTEIYDSGLITGEAVVSTEVDEEELLQFVESREDNEIISTTEIAAKSDEVIGTEKIQIEEITEMPAPMHTKKIGTTNKLRDVHEILIYEDMEAHLFQIEEYFKDMEENLELKRISGDSTLPSVKTIENSFQEMTGVETLNFDGSGGEILTDLF